MGDHLHHASVLIVSDDTGFARAVVARWQAERHVPEITLVTSDVWHAGSASGHDLVIVGPVRDGKTAAILHAINASHGTAAAIVTEDEKNISALRADYPHLLVVPMQDGWAGALILISSEALRRVEAVSRAQTSRTPGVRKPAQRDARQIHAGNAAQRE